MPTVEQFTNNANAPLAADITDTDVALSVDNPLGGLFPTGNFRIILDDEIIWVGARTGNNFTSLLRGQEGTVAAAHTATTLVSHILTAETLETLPAIFKDGTLVATRRRANYTGAGVTVTDNPGTGRADIAISGGLQSPMQQKGDLITQSAAGSTSVSNSNSSGNQSINTTTAEVVVAGCDLILPGVGASVTLNWNVFVSANISGTPKNITLRVRRDSLTGTVLASTTLSMTVDTSNGHDQGWNSSYNDTAPTTGHYVITCQPNVTYTIWSDTRTFSASTTLIAAPARLGVGTNGQVPTADSSAILGISYGKEIAVPRVKLDGTTTGAAAATRYVGGTVSGAPTTGTFAVGDFVIAQDAHVFVCTTAGTPGTWADVTAGVFVNPMTAKGQIIAGIGGPVNYATAAMGATAIAVQYWGGGGAASNAIDGNDATSTSSDGNTFWQPILEVDLGQARAIYSIRFLLTTTLNSNVWYIESSTDNSNWTTRYTSANVSNSDQTITPSGAPVTARYWRIRSSASGGGQMTVYSLELRGSGTAGSPFAVSPGADGAVPTYDSTATAGIAAGGKEILVPDVKVSGLTGATAASRYVGATATGAPASGTFAIGDFVVAQNGHIWICTVAGTPGTWVDASAGGGGGSALTIQEIDGAPTGTPTTLKVSNGALTDNGDGSFTLATSGGAGYHEEFLPANAATTITLSQVPTSVLAVTRNGVAQSVADGHYSLSGATLTFSTAFDGTERVVVAYTINGAGGSGGALVKISEQVLSGTAASVTFSNIPQTGFRDLVIHYIARGDAAVTQSDLQCQANGDTGANYDRQYQDSTSTTVSTGNDIGATLATVGKFAGASATSGSVAQGVVRWQGYAATTYRKAFRSEGTVNMSDASGGVLMFANGGEWRNTAAITSLRFFPASGNLVAGSVFTLYGVGDNQGGGGSVSDTYANLPSAGVNGRLFLPSDGFSVLRDSGSAWVPWGPLFPLTDPNLQTWAWINQTSGGQSGSVDTSAGGVYVSTPALAGDNLRIRKKAAPSTPYTITAGFLPNLAPANYSMGGLVFRESSSGKLVSYHLVVNSASNIGVYVENNRWNSPTAIFNNANQFTPANLQFGNPLLWLRIADDGTNRIFSISGDGRHWITTWTIGRTDHLTADEVGFFVSATNGTYDAGMWLLSWKES